MATPPACRYVTEEFPNRPLPQSMSKCGELGSSAAHTWAPRRT